MLWNYRYIEHFLCFITSPKNYKNYIKKFMGYLNNVCLYKNIFGIIHAYNGLKMVDLTEKTPF